MGRMGMKQRTAVTVGMALLIALAALGSAQAKHLGLNGREDFAETFRRGGLETIPIQPDGTFLANVGSQRNSYPWSGAWFAFLGKFFIGTVRDLLCFIGGGLSAGPECPASGLPGENQRAEIWAYGPTGPGGIGGTWQRVHQSADAGPLIQLLAPGTIRDIGYRSMTVGAVGDATERLWIAAFGAGGHILHTAGWGGLLHT